MIGKTFVYKIQDGFLVGIVQKIIEKHASVYFTSFVDEKQNQSPLRQAFSQLTLIKDLITPVYA